MEVLEVSEKRVCIVVGQHHSVQRYESRESELNELLTQRTTELSSSLPDRPQRILRLE